MVGHCKLIYFQTGSLIHDKGNFEAHKYSDISVCKVNFLEISTRHTIRSKETMTSSGIITFFMCATVAELVLHSMKSNQ